MDQSYVQCMLIYWGCLLVKNSFVNISEVNRQCLHSLGTRSEDDFEKVSIFNIYTFEHNKSYMFKSFSCSVICPPGKSNLFVNVKTIFL